MLPLIHVKRYSVSLTPEEHSAFIARFVEMFLNYNKAWVALFGQAAAVDPKQVVALRELLVPGYAEVFQRLKEGGDVLVQSPSELSDLTFQLNPVNASIEVFCRHEFNADERFIVRDISLYLPVVPPSVFYKSITSGETREVMLNLNKI